jgi:hypothetical protein
MPRPERTPRNTGSPVDGRLVERFMYERERRKISFEELSALLEKAGAPIPVSGLYRLQSGERSITAAEWVAFCQIFGLTLANTFGYSVDEIREKPELGAAPDEKYTNGVETFLRGVRAYLTTWIDLCAASENQDSRQLAFFAETRLTVIRALLAFPEGNREVAVRCAELIHEITTGLTAEDSRRMVEEVIAERTSS